MILFGLLCVASGLGLIFFRTYSDWYAASAAGAFVAVVLGVSIGVAQIKGQLLIREFIVIQDEARQVEPGVWFDAAFRLKVAEANVWLDQSVWCNTRWWCEEFVPDAVEELSLIHMGDRGGGS